MITRTFLIVFLKKLSGAFMLKKIFLSLSLGMIPALAMQEEAKTAAINTFQPGVQQADYIQIEHSQLCQILVIHDMTTIADLKHKLLNEGTIPVCQSELRPIWKEESYWLIPTWVTPDKFGPNLDDARNVKEIMNQYNTCRLALSLLLRKPQDN